ncbi:FadR family transcriptional regulator (plasmid) [Sphingomonas paeninsulae]|jgi:DNA-binding FadR family transcriptional regulator|uniref:FadR family transcriptional regulator n=1 Tax=Sphingomonas paeninsulae TaxID=2319844 RepID=A0A494T6U6_SPHPE|nr:FCD domain-containing protein [Sphingomonas paeninsulae]AYJ85119.1 FadR family transcriptional regulator [Sphingomonas paeninsulae]
MIYNGGRQVDETSVNAANTKQPTTREEYLTRQAIRVPKTAEVVADHIRRRIIRGELKEGDFLPPEGQLMATLGISRPTLRESFRILEAEMLISVVRGSRTGARVHQPRVESVSRYAGFVLAAQGTTIADIYEARLAIEPYIARRLAEKQVPGATDRLRAEAERLTGFVESARYVDFMIGLAEFHRLLVELGGNHTLLFVIAILQDVVEHYQVTSLTRRGMPEDLQRKRSLWGIRSYRKLIELIDAGDADGAEAHWRLHVINSNKSWLDTGNGERLLDILE